MSTNIDTRPPFFPRSKTEKVAEKSIEKTEGLQKNSPEKIADLSLRTNADAKVTIPDGVKDFSKIKKVAQAAPELDKSDKIAKLKADIQAGTYEVNYDEVADKMLQQEF